MNSVPFCESADVQAADSEPMPSYAPISLEIPAERTEGAEPARDLANPAIDRVIPVLYSEEARRLRTPLSRLLPDLKRLGDTQLPVDRLSTRAGNLLRRHAISTWRELIARSPSDLYGYPQAGKKSVIEFLDLCVEYVTAKRGLVDEPGDRTDDASFDLGATSINESPDPYPLHFRDEDPLYEMFRTRLPIVAAWAVRETSMTKFAQVWRFGDEAPIPESLRQLFAEIGSVDLADLADNELVQTRIQNANVAFRAEFNEVQLTVLDQRLLTKSHTLDEIGRALGVTRERIRQIEGKVRAKTGMLAASPTGWPLKWRAETLASELGDFAPINSEHTRRILDRVTEQTPASEQITELLLYLGGPYLSREGWYVREGFTLPVARDMWSDLGAPGILESARVSGWLATKGMHSRFVDNWLTDFGRVRRDAGMVLDWSGTVVDKCEILLRLRGTPLDAESLVELIGEGNSARSVRQRLFADPRLMRVNRNDWALRDWELEEYTGIADEIKQRINEWGGSAPLSRLIDELVRQFDVNRGSVRLYAEAPMFEIHDGIVTLREDGATFRGDTDLSRCRSIFDLGAGRYTFLIAVDAGVLRGSGRGIPAAFADVLGVRPGSPVEFVSDAGTRLTITWPPTAALGPSMGSTRLLAMEVGAEAGDAIRLEFDTEIGVLSVFRVQYPELQTLSQQEQVASLTGILAADIRSALAVAIHADSSSVERALRARGDDRVADLLPVEVLPSDLEDALADLAKIIGDD